MLDLPCLDTKSWRGTISSASISSSPCGTGARGTGAVVTSVSCAWGLEEWVDNVVISVRLGQLCWPREVGLFVWCVCVCVLGGGGCHKG